MANKSIRLSDGTDTLLPESATSIKNSFGSLVKCADGTLIQYGTLTINSGSYVGTVGLPTSFVDNTYIVAVCSYETGIVSNLSGAKTVSSFTLGRTPNTAASHFDWIAIGRWK